MSEHFSATRTLIFLDARTLSSSTTKGGVFRVWHPGLETRKKFAETQMMVVRFDSDHTDSEFRKVWPGMAGKLVVSSIQID